MGPAAGGVGEDATNINNLHHLSNRIAFLDKLLSHDRIGCHHRKNGTVTGTMVATISPRVANQETSTRRSHTRSLAGAQQSLRRRRRANQGTSSRRNARKGAVLTSLTGNQRRQGWRGKWLRGKGLAAHRRRLRVPRHHGGLRTPPAAPFNSNTHIMDGYLRHDAGMAADLCAEPRGTWGFDSVWATASRCEGEGVTPAR